MTSRDNFTSALVDCPYKERGCKKAVRARGLSSHVNSCPFKIVDPDPQDTEDPEYRGMPDLLPVDDDSDDEDEWPTLNAALADVNRAVDAQSANDETVALMDDDQDPPVANDNMSPQAQDPPELEDAPRDVSQEPREEFDIKVNLHPHTSTRENIFRFDDYVGFGDNSVPPIPSDPEPWKPPFHTRFDFELAELMLDCHMNEKQSKALLSLLQKMAPASDTFTIADFKHLSELWDYARRLRTDQFIHKAVSVKYHEESLEYPVYYRPLWSWCRELLSNADIVRRFEWDARKIFSWNGEEFQWIFDEPWTADSWWNYQSRIPADGKPFCIILYADKTRLSSFGTEKGYPVVVRCANLPVEIRNGEGEGGGQLIGWLPIPEEDARETGKKHFIRLKREIWHRAMYEIIGSIETYAESGFHIECGDGIQRRIFPHILMLSADFEEQCMMALTRGVNASFPCPVCLVPADDLTSLSSQFTLRTTKAMHDVWHQSQALNATGKEELLKSYGLRDVKNTFWEISGVDIYPALSWDRLHTFHGGLFSDHILDELKHVAGVLGRETLVKINDALDSVPRWAGLNHISALGKTGEFADGTKFEDLSKVLLLACLHAFTSMSTPEGYLLLKLLRSYMELDMYASLTVHTTATIEAGRREQEHFEIVVKEYANQFPGKNWDFPKVHTQQHLFDDVINKGMARNYNTKPGEKMNGPLKKYYQRHTNFKNVAPQILKVAEKDLAALIIRSEITRLDAHQEATENEDNSDDDDDDDIFERTRMGSKIKPLTISSLEQLNALDPAFGNLHKKIGAAIAGIIGVPQVRLHTAIEVTPYRNVKVMYASIVNWNWTPTIVRANPNFQNRPRYDFVLIQTSAGQYCLSQVLYLFRIAYVDQIHSLALILPFDLPKLPRNRTRDEHLRLIRICPRRRQDAIVIDVGSIVRGVLLMADPDSQGGEFLVVENVNEDIWMRLKTVELSMRIRF